MKGLIFAFLLFHSSLASAQGYGVWYFDYVEGDAEGRISACNAGVDFSNAWFVARLFGEELDFVYYRDDFTLPFGEVLGSVIFRIDSKSFVVAASTNSRPADELAQTSRTLFFMPNVSDRGPLFVALRDGNRFQIEFPNGDTYQFPLVGSGRALVAASECWSHRPTGPFSNNPFAPTESVNNPFDAL